MCACVWHPCSSINNPTGARTHTHVHAQACLCSLETFSDSFKAKSGWDPPRVGSRMHFYSTIVLEYALIVLSFTANKHFYYAVLEIPLPLPLQGGGCAWDGGNVPFNLPLELSSEQSHHWSHDRSNDNAAGRSLNCSIIFQSKNSINQQ